MKLRQLPVALARAVTPARVRPRLFQLAEDNRLFRVLHGEARVIEAELRPGSTGAWTQLVSGHETARMTERVVEIPWVLTRIGQCSRLLDIGTAFAPRVYVRGLLSLGISSLCGLDLSSVRVGGVSMTKADVRRMPFAADQFDVLTCISTIEHIGLENVHYAAGSERIAGQDAVALAEMERVIRPGGRVLITVPFGEFGMHSWFKQYDLQAWRDLVASTSLTEQEVSLFKLTTTGWVPCELGDPPAGRYRGNGAPGATSVLCASLTKPDGPARAG